jgi:hypothetical protein
MTSLRQIEANRRNARLSTGPISEEGKRRSRQNAVRHGLTAETVIDALEDAEDYAAFEMAIARLAYGRRLVSFLPLTWIERRFVFQRNQSRRKWLEARRLRHSS